MYLYETTIDLKGSKSGNAFQVGKTCLYRSARLNSMSYFITIFETPDNYIILYNLFINGK